MGELALFLTPKRGDFFKFPSPLYALKHFFKFRIRHFPTEADAESAIFLASAGKEWVQFGGLLNDDHSTVVDIDV